MPSKITYPAILKFFYDYHLNDNLSPAAMSIAQAIIYKWNYLRRQNEFMMTNKELAELSNIRTHIGRNRKYVIEKCLFEGKPLFGYKSNGQARAGTYYVFSEIIPVNYQENTKQVPNKYQTLYPQVNDPKESKEKKDPLLPIGPNTVTTTGGEVENLDSAEEEEEDLISKILGKIDHLFAGYVIQPATKAHDDVGEIAQFTEEAINEAFIAAKRAGIRRGNLNWILDRLRHPERYGLDDGDKLDTRWKERDKENERKSLERQKRLYESEGLAWPPGPNAGKDSAKDTSK